MIVGLWLLGAVFTYGIWLGKPVFFDRPKAVDFLTIALCCIFLWPLILGIYIG